MEEEGVEYYCSVTQALQPCLLPSLLKSTSKVHLQPTTQALRLK